MPTLISPSYVVIQQHNLDATLYDDDRREVIGAPARTQIVLLAQVSIGSSNRASRRLGGQGGIEEDKSGHLVFLQSGLDDAGITLKRGDQVTRIATDSAGSGGWETSMYLYRERRGGHWETNTVSADQTFVIWYLSDRRPAEP